MLRIIVEGQGKSKRQEAEGQTLELGRKLVIAQWSFLIFHLNSKVELANLAENSRIRVESSKNEMRNDQ